MDAEALHRALTTLPWPVADELARLLAPMMARHLLTTPKIFGDPARLRVGENVSLVNTMFNLISGTVTIEDHAFFGHDVSVLTGTHDMTLYDAARQLGVPTEGRDVIIERGVWIGSNATILGPCRIGRDAVIAAGSVVLDDMPAGHVCAGAPARPIRQVVPGYPAMP